ncbi:putative L-azetidine-2-carboxylic acid acetyltransferase [Glarea lozoyensis 74030]|uniref:Putative L-azetidine-2-carboxylic acid acetyltransferase n=1 Tax=Glarea lozoyensis (strain ATCC 74030 / MF5533) TaxID=1104152 RepID=H0EPD4_GLAL7|nr:putative L-azetidine-2-carboxylic acid acetyltransferase [Glarea lozoyensis 74030]
MNGLPDDKFASYWFQNFGAVMILGNIESADEISADQDWATQCLGSFYIKPNYPGRSSHVCNAGFLVTEAARNKGVGRLLGEQYIEWAPKLGYVYSVFNLVYETNVASCRIWDALGFKRIGRVKGAGNLKSYPGQLVDAIIYGRDLGPEGEDFVSEERFDKIKFYLKYGKYPAELGKTPPVRPAEPLVNRPPPPVPDPVPSPTFKAGQGSVSPQVLNRALPPSQRRTYHEPHQTQAPIAKMSHGERGGGTEGEGMGDELDMLIDEEEGEGMGERQRYQGDDGDSEAEDGEVGRQLRHEGTRELRGRRNGFGDGG